MVLALRDYIDLTVQDSVAQWRAILRRDRVPTGGRQEDFFPIETLLCFGLGLIGNRTNAGNINIPESSPYTRAFSGLFKRTPKSIAAKLANLDGRRPNSAKNERELWITLTQERFLFEALYARILQAGREVGLDAATLPDFLGYDDKRLQIVLEADRVSDDDLRDSVANSLAAVKDSGSIENIRDTERAMVGTARVGQQQFARKVLDNAGFQCVFCGLGMRASGLPSARMLIASHIKPWRDSEAAERTDSRNGLAACPTHDAAFESHLFTVRYDGRVERSQALLTAVQSDARMRHNFGDEGMSDILMLPAGALRPSRAYVDWHYDRTLMVEFDPKHHAT